MGLRTGMGVAAGGISRYKGTTRCCRLSSRPLAARTLREARPHRFFCVETLMILLRRSHTRSPHLEHKNMTARESSYAAKEVPMPEKWKAFWARLFGGSYGWSRRDKVLEYVVHRIDDGAHVRGGPGRVRAPDGYAKRDRADTRRPSDHRGRQGAYATGAQVRGFDLPENVEGEAGRRYYGGRAAGRWCGPSEIGYRHV
jgi:hypothetical protein